MTIENARIESVLGTNTSVWVECGSSGVSSRDYTGRTQ